MQHTLVGLLRAAIAPDRMRVAEAITISAPAEQVWAIVSVQCVLEFMSGVTRWEMASPNPTGLGARYRVLFRIGSAEIGGLIEIVEWGPACDLAWTSVTGLDQRRRWRLRDTGRGGTRVKVRLAYGVAGADLAGWIAEHVAKPAVSGHLRRSLRQLKRLGEYEQLREQAATQRSSSS